ncbi:MAG: aldo/keto reductase [Planctomycetota bacterium]
MPPTATAPRTRAPSAIGQRAAAREWYRETNIPLVTWSSVARGFFSGRITSANYKEKADLFRQCDRDAFWYPDNFRRLDRACELAAEKGVTVPQIAVAYVLSYPLNTFALVGSASPDEVRANLAAVDIELTPDEMAWLNLERDDR